MAAQQEQQQPGSSELLDPQGHPRNSQDLGTWPGQPGRHSTEAYDDAQRLDAVSPMSQWADHPAYQPVATAEPPPIQQDDPPYAPEAPLKSAKEQQPAQHPRLRRYCGGGWSAEIASAVFSILCVVAIVVILSRIDGRLLSSWTIAVSPNAVIAVLSTAAKAAMLLPVAESISQLKWLYLQGLHPKGTALGLQHLQIFDDASRGPWGALKLFWLARRVPFTTYVGCLVTIAALAVDPFTQQILSFEQKSTPVPGAQSTVTRSQVYDNQGTGVHGTANVVDPTRDGLLQAAAVSGVYDLVSPPPFRCPGSNCTYPVFTSLAICSQCSDVTAPTLKSCEYPLEGYPAQICNFTMPGGFSPQAFAAVDAHNGFTHTSLNISVNRTIAMEGSTRLITMGMIRFTVDDMANGSADDKGWQDTLKAYECRYDVCARAYSNWTTVKGTVVHGATQDSPLNITGMGPVAPFKALQEGFPGNATFMMNYLDVENMNTALATIFDPDFGGKPGGNTFTAALYNSRNLTRTVENIAAGMSFRMLAGPNATAVFGEVFAVQTYMRTHWAWLSLLAALEVLTCLFLVSVIVATSRAGQPAWKSSMAPLLYDDGMPDGNAKTEPAGERGGH